VKVQKVLELFLKRQSWNKFEIFPSLSYVAYELTN